MRQNVFGYQLANHVPTPGVKVEVWHEGEWKKAILVESIRVEYRHFSRRTGGSEGSTNSADANYHTEKKIRNWWIETDGAYKKCDFGVINTWNLITEYVDKE